MSIKLLNTVITESLSSLNLKREDLSSISIDEQVDLQFTISDAFVQKYKNDISVDLSDHLKDKVFSLSNNNRFQSYLKDNLFKCLSIYLRYIYARFDVDSKDYQESLSGFYEYCEASACHLECYDCGQNLGIYLDFTTMTMKTKLKEPCIFNTMTRHHSMDLDLTCGQVLFANDMRRLFGDRDKTRGVEEEFRQRRNNGNYISVNNVFGRMLNTEMWAENGMMYFQTGNTSPNYYFNKEKNYFIFRDSFEEWEEYQDEAPDLKNLPFVIEPDNETYVGWVCTDLWAVNAMSMETFKKLCKENNLDEDKMIKELSIKIHNVTKGVYQCTTYYETIGDSNLNIYHSIELKY